MINLNSKSPNKTPVDHPQEPRRLLTAIIITKQGTHTGEPGEPSVWGVWVMGPKCGGTGMVVSWTEHMCQLGIQVNNIMTA